MAEKQTLTLLEQIDQAEQELDRVQNDPNIGGQGILSQLVAQAGASFGEVADFFQGLGLTEEEFDRIKDISPLRNETQIRRPIGTAEELAATTGSLLPEVALDAAVIAGTGGLGAGAVLPELGKTAFAGGVAGGLGGALGGSATFGDGEREDIGALEGAVAGVATAPVVPLLRPLGKFIPGLRNIVDPVTLRQSFQNALETSALGADRHVINSILPRDNTVDAFLAGTPLRMKTLGETFESVRKGVIGDEPFRRLKGDPQFQADTVVQRGARKAGLSSPQAKTLMEALTPDERKLLAMEIDPFVRGVKEPFDPRVEIERATRAIRVLADHSNQGSFSSNRFPVSLDVEVRIGDDVFTDTIDGLNAGHALSRARQNWEGAQITPIRTVPNQEDFAGRLDLLNYLEDLNAGRALSRPSEVSKLFRSVGIDTPGAIPLEEALQRAAPRIPSRTFIDQVKSGIARQAADGSDEVVTLRQALDQAQENITDATSEPDAMMFMGMLPNMPPTRMQNTVSLARKGVKKTTNFLRDLRLAGMLTSFTAPMKNVTFNAINLGANVTGRIAAGGIDATRSALTGKPREVFAGEAAALVQGFWRGIQDDLATYGQISRLRREALDESKIPIISLGSDFLKWQDAKFFDRAFAMEMTAEAYRQAAKEGKKGFRAISNRADQILTQEANVTSAMFQAQAQKVRQTLGRNASDQEVATKAAEILRRSGQEPTSVQEARLFSERSIFIAREGRLLDQTLDLADKMDSASGGIMSVIAPFRRTPMNELREFLRSVDMGTLAFRRLQQDTAAGVPEEVARARLARDLGKSAVGASALAGMTALSAAGAFEVIRNDKLKSRAQRSVEAAQGISQDSLRVGEVVVPLSTAGPVGRLANIADFLTKNFAQGGIQTEEQAEAASNILVSLFGQMTTIMENESIVGDLIDFFDAMHTEQGRQRFAAQTGASFVPGVIRQGRRLFVDEEPITVVSDQNLREGSFISAAEQEALRDGEQLLGLFGEARTRPGGFLGTLGVRTQLRNTPQARMAALMQDVGVFAEPPDTSIPGIDWSGSAEQNTFGKAKGRLQFFEVNRAVNRNRAHFDSLPKEDQQRVIRSAMRRASRRANDRARTLKRRGLPVTEAAILRGRVGL